MILPVSFFSRSPALPDFRIAEKEFADFHIPPSLMLSLDPAGFTPVGEYPRRVEAGEVLARRGSFPLLAPLGGGADLQETGQGKVPRRYIRIRVSGSIRPRDMLPGPDDLQSVESVALFFDKMGLRFLDGEGLSLSDALRICQSSGGLRDVVLCDVDAEIPLHWKKLLQGMKKERADFVDLIERLFPEARISSLPRFPVSDRIDFFQSRLFQPAIVLRRALRRKRLKSPSGLLQEGVLFLGPATQYSVLRALFRGEPFTHRPVVFRDFLRRRDLVAVIPNGTVPSDLFAEILPEDGWEHAPGFATTLEDAAAREKGAGEFVREKTGFLRSFAFQIEYHQAFYRFRRVRGTIPCTGCRACNDICPVDARPLSLLFDGKRFEGDACFRCGLCELVCESNIPFSHRLGGIA